MKNPNKGLFICGLVLYNRHAVRIFPLLHHEDAMEKKGTKTIRDTQVILDRDLALVYGVDSRVLNLAIKRNTSRFPVDFMFQLTKEEWKNMSSQIVMTSPQRRPLSALPYAFAESGITMLSSVLRLQTAIEVNIRVMRAFVSMRHFLANFYNSVIKHFCEIS